MNNILMNVPMAKATIEDRKTNTRRIAKDIKLISNGQVFLSKKDKDGWEIDMPIDEFIEKFAKYQIDEVIWVREPARVLNYSSMQNSMQCKYLADETIKSFMIPPRIRQNGGIDYPKWITKTNEGKSQGIPNGCIKEMARIFLKVTNVRVERLQDISYEDTMAEGCDIDISDCVKYEGDSQEESVSYSLYCWYRDLWNSTAPKGYKWEDNPYVFVYEFERVQND